MWIAVARQYSIDRQTVDDLIDNIMAKANMKENELDPVGRELIMLIRLQDLKDSPYQGRWMGLEEKEEGSRVERQILELARSIESSGLMQPIIVRAVEGGYEIIDGHRRVEAHRRLGRGQIRAIVKDCTEREAQVMSVVGNLQRQNLSPIELAVSYRNLLATGVFKDKRELSQAIGKDETYVGDLLNTLNMDSRIIDDLRTERGIRDLRLLRAIRRVDKVDQEGVSGKQFELYMTVKHKKLSRKQVDDLLRQEWEPVKRSKGWKIKRTNKGITLKLTTKKIPQGLLDRLEEVLAFELEARMAEYKPGRKKGQVS